MYKELKGYIIFYAFTIIIFSAIIFANIYTHRQKITLKVVAAELNRVSTKIEWIKARMQETKGKQGIERTSPAPTNHLKKTMEIVDEIRVRTGGNVVVNGSLLADDIPLTITVKTPDFKHFINSLKYLQTIEETNNLIVMNIEGTKEGVYTIKGKISK
ncbi:MAG: hypothetical protein HZC45_01490 [Deltaproteobacteria bacterium]|nr:hypothetical protein [Deltaproteobacteria bacterium]